MENTIRIIILFLKSNSIVFIKCSIIIYAILKYYFKENLYKYNST